MLITLQNDISSRNRSFKTGRMFLPRGNNCPAPRSNLAPKMIFLARLFINLARFAIFLARKMPDRARQTTNLARPEIFGAGKMINRAGKKLNLAWFVSDRARKNIFPTPSGSSCPRKTTV